MRETTEYAATFALVDTDGDGRISAEEFVSLMHKLGDECTPERAAEVVRAMDGDHDDLISLEEFARHMAQTRA